MNLKTAIGKTLNKLVNAVLMRNKCDNTSSAAAAAIDPSPAFQSRGSGQIGKLNRRCRD